MARMIINGGKLQEKWGWDQEALCKRIDDNLVLIMQNPTWTSVYSSMYSDNEET